MSTAQINEIISLLQAIADSSMANKIAFIATLVSACALLSSIYFSHKTNVQYLNSLSPLLSCELSENAGILYLTISNTGQSKATKIKVSLERISNNGERNEFVTDDIFKEELELYPNEKITDNIEHNGITLNILTNTIQYNDKSVELTKNEFKILHYLLINRGKIVSRVDILDYLWDSALFVNDNTLTVNITRIRNKMEELGIKDYIKTKRGQGYMI